MRSYTGDTVCPCCKQIVAWVYRDDGYRPSEARDQEYITQTSVPSDSRDVAICNRVFTRTRRIFLEGYCPYCGMPFGIDYTENILKETAQQNH